MKQSVVALVAAMALAFAAFAGTRTVRAQPPPKQAVVETTAGSFVIDLATDAAPNTAAYFMKLAGEGGYEGTIFHRAVKYGMVQGGDPLTWDPLESTCRHASLSIL